LRRRACSDCSISLASIPSSKSSIANRTRFRKPARPPRRKHSSYVNWVLIAVCLNHKLERDQFSNVQEESDANGEKTYDSFKPYGQRCDLSSETGPPKSKTAFEALRIERDGRAARSNRERTES